MIKITLIQLADDESDTYQGDTFVAALRELIDCIEVAANDDDMATIMLADILPGLAEIAMELSEGNTSHTYRHHDMSGGSFDLVLSASD
jgi:hypothetical protein